MSTKTTATFKSLTSTGFRQLDLNGAFRDGEGRGGMLIALVATGENQPKLRLEIKQPPVAKKKKKNEKKEKVDTCFRNLHQEDNKAVFFLYR